ncbi:MAG: uridine kinase [Bacilli bacterium]|jgi:uridine kinase
MATIILIGGGSASGKTFVIEEVTKSIGEEYITHISIDDYYKKVDDMSIEDRRKINYDHPRAFDWQLFRTDLESLKNNKSIEKPIYDYVILNRSDKTETVKPKQIILVEGITALVDKKCRDLADLKVFINASRERRLVRRIERDQKERGRTFENIVEQYFESVQPMYEEIIGPSQVYADVIINNDGRKNNSIRALTAIIKDYIK